MKLRLLCLASLGCVLVWGQAESAEQLAGAAKKGLGFRPGRVLYVGAEGRLESVLGPETHCVTVTGTTVPCGAVGELWRDIETPVGLVNGTNRVFVLQAAPVPPSSLHLFRNGLLMSHGVDFGLSGNTVTFVAGQVPTEGDIVRASYRVEPSVVPPVASVAAAAVQYSPQGQVLTSHADGQDAEGAAQVQQMAAVAHPSASLAPAMQQSMSLQQSVSTTGTESLATASASRNSQGASPVQQASTSPVLMEASGSSSTGRAFDQAVTREPKKRSDDASPVVDTLGEKWREFLSDIVSSRTTSIHKALREMCREQCSSTEAVAIPLQYLPRSY